MYLQAGIFGLGPNSSLNQWFGRDDVSFQFIWQLDGMGIGNLARIKQQRGQQSQAIIDLFHWQDQVAADVNRALCAPPGVDGQGQPGRPCVADAPSSLSMATTRA